MKWSKYQKDIFRAIRDTDESIAIKAVPGSGKTTTIVRSSKLLDFSKSAIFLAFNKAIASELNEKISPICDASTFHGIGATACAQNLPKVVIEQNKYWPIISAYIDRPIEPFGGLFSSAYPLLQLVDAARCRRVKLTPRGVETLTETMGILGVRAGSTHTWAEVAKHIKACIKRGTKLALKQGVIDFTDMVWLPCFKDWDIQPYTTVYVDEAQDLNPVQLTLLQKIVETGGRLIMVGDPNQAIYAFTGAMSESFFITKETFQAREMPLSVCYRCPTSHLEIARRFCKTVEAAPNAVEGSVDEISYSSLQYELSNHTSSNLLICRSKAPLIKTFINLLAEGVECQFNKGTILNSIISLIEILENGYGASMSNLDRYLAEYHADEKTRLEESHPGGAKMAIRNLGDNVEALRTLLYAFRRSCSSVIVFKAKIRSLAKKKGNTTLSTVHGAKGLEADWVGVLDWEKMPLNINGMSDEQRKQEKNLQLIASTRSKQHLRLIPMPDDE